MANYDATPAAIARALDLWYNRKNYGPARSERRSPRQVSQISYILRSFASNRKGLYFVASLSCQSRSAGADAYFEILEATDNLFCKRLRNPY